jgi:fructose-bisphosphate aldolase class II
MTSPEEARRFDRESGVDALAISAGNVHLSTGKTTAIDFDVIRRIEAVTRSPLVLHGGSGIPLAVRRQLARETRVKKFNIGTELRMAFGSALRKSLADHPGVFDRLQLLGETIAPLKAEAKAVMMALARDQG